jgi:phytoene dehydrogenase-like protein
MSKKILIIGGGVAGLSSGIYARMNGFDTEIIEMHTIPGGQCTAWVKKGYRFDYCLHWLVGTSRGQLNSIWKETNVINNETTVIDHEIFARISDGQGEDFIIYTDINRWKKYLLEMAPEDTGSIRKMCNDMRKGSLYEPADEGGGFRGIIKRCYAKLKMIPVLPLLIRYGRKDCNAYFKKLNFKNPRITYFLNKTYGARNFSAIAFIMMLGWFNKKNAGYLIGGSLPLAQRMAEKYISLGGKLTPGKKVDKIIVEKNIAKGVILTDKTLIRADYVIGAADGHSTIFEMLEGKYLSKEIKEAYSSWELFTPIVQVSFGINSKITSEYPVQSFIAEGKSIGSTKLRFGYSLMTYSFDPTMAPEGKTVIVLRFESPWDYWKDLNKDQYRKEKELIKSDAVIILETQFPEVTGKIEVIDVATPLTDVRYTGVWKGSYEGFSPSAENITKELKNTLPGLDNFYMAGQWLFPGGGIPPSVLSGKSAIKQICKKERKSFRSNSLNQT